MWKDRLKLATAEPGVWDALSQQQKWREFGECFGFNLLFPRSCEEEILPKESCDTSQSPWTASWDLLDAATADFTSDGRKKHSVRDWGSEGKEEAKVDEREEKAVQHSQTSTQDWSSSIGCCCFVDGYTPCPSHTTQALAACAQPFNAGWCNSSMKEHRGAGIWQQTRSFHKNVFYYCSSDTDGNSESHCWQHTADVFRFPVNNGNSCRCAENWGVNPFTMFGRESV